METTSKMENSKHVIFNVEELSKVDFSAVCETSQYTVRRSINKEKTFITWDSEEEPWFLNTITTKEGPYTTEELRNILNTEDWRSQMIIQNSVKNTQWQ